MRSKDLYFLVVFHLIVFCGSKSSKDSGASLSEILNAKLTFEKNDDPLQKAPKQLTLVSSPKQQLKKDHGTPETPSALDDLFNPPYSKFGAKHLFQNGELDENGNVFDSFSLLSQDAKVAKDYLINKHMKLFNEGILPREQGFNGWFKDIRKENPKKITPLTIIDSTEAILQEDIKSSHNFPDEWTKRQKTLATEGTHPTFETQNEYTVTIFEYKTLQNPKSEILGLEVTLTKMKGKVTLGVTKDGRPVHLGLEDRSRMKPEGEPFKFTFSMDELMAISKRIDQFYKKFMPSNKKRVLNEYSKTYKKKRAAIDNKLNELVEKYANERKFGIRRDKTYQEVEAVDVDKFLRESKSAPKTVTKSMLDLLAQKKLNKDQFLSQDATGKATENLLELIKDKDLFDHNDKLEILNEVQESNKESVHIPEKIDIPSERSNKIAEIFDGVFEKVGSFRVRLSSTKIGKVMAALSATKGAKGVAKSYGVIGRVLMLETFVKGIVSKDPTSIAISSTMLGLDGIASAGTWLTKKGGLLENAGRLGGFTKTLAKVTGVLGIGIGAGMDVYTFSSSIHRAIDATNGFERADAIADAVGSALDLVAVAVMLVNPVAGIVLAVAFQLFVGIFHAFNGASSAVHQLNSEVPLLATEKISVYFGTLFGTRQSDYMDSMVLEKKLNDRIVKTEVDMLKTHPDLLGSVFPSQTPHYDGGCRLTKRYCSLKNAWGCTSWGEDRWTMESGCDWRGPCAVGNRFGRGICDNYWDYVGAWGYDDFQCLCDREDRSSQTTFSHPRKNSRVYLGRKQTVFWERAVPSDVEYANLICRPGNEDNRGRMVSQGSSRYDYLCENAIGVMRREISKEMTQMMLYSLEDGNDIVEAWPGAPALFILGNQGLKSFMGEEKDDSFVFDVFCNASLTGTIDGRGGFDSMVMSFNCPSGSYQGPVEVDFQQGILRLSPQILNMRIRNIEAYVGRDGEADRVRVACTTRKVECRGGGGMDTQDEILIPMEAQCNHDLVVVAGPYTNVTSQAARGKLGVYVNGSKWTGIEMDLEMHDKENMTTSVTFMETAAHQIVNWTVSRESDNVTSILHLNTTTDSIDLKFRMRGNVKDLQVNFMEKENSTAPYSVFYVNENETVALFYHSLGKGKDSVMTRRGCPNVENVFEINGPFWNIVGGELADEIVLNTTQLGRIDGGGGVDSIKFGVNFSEHLVLDLRGSVKNVENVYGLRGVPLTVITACDTQLVGPQGGTPLNPDLVMLSTDSCSQRNLEILATGHVKVVMTEAHTNQTGANDTVRLVVDATENADLSFELDGQNANNFQNLFVVIPVNHTNWTVVNSTLLRNSVALLEIHGQNPSNNNKTEKLQFRFSSEANHDDDGNSELNTPYIQFSPGNFTPGRLVLNRDSLLPTLHFSLNGSDMTVPPLVQGFTGIRNIISLTTTSARKVSAIGGDLDDEFLVITPTSPQEQFAIDGAGQGEHGNTLVFVDMENNTSPNLTMVVNLVKGEANLLSSSVRNQVINVQRVVGRTQASDLIYPACDSQLVHGRGGQNTQQQDVVTMGVLNCTTPPQLAIVVGNFTRVKIEEKIGKFMYAVDDLWTSSLELTTTTNNSHQLQFSFHPWNVLKAVAFHQDTNTLGWKIEQNGYERIQTFNMVRSSENENEFTNPSFFFNPPGSSVRSDIRVRASTGATIASFQVNHRFESNPVFGLPVDVNRFVVNVTDSVSPEGRLVGSSNSAMNQFWVLAFNAPLQLLDGGRCPNNSCANYLQLDSSFEPPEHNLIVDLDLDAGSAHTEKGTNVISRLLNIHSFSSGREYQNITVYAGCPTKQVSNVSQVVIRNTTACALKLVLGVGAETRVWFNDTSETNKNVSGDSFVQYDFLTVRSFDPEGSHEEMIRHQHVYRFAFPLREASDLWLNPDTLIFHYKHNGSVHAHSMIVEPGPLDQFYNEPSFITSDGYRLQIGREGSIWAISTQEDQPSVTPDQVGDLQQMADRLGANVMLTSGTYFYNIGGKSKNGSMIKALENTGNKTCHLAAHGSDDTVYKLHNLEQDAVIYTGYHESANGSQDYEALKRERKQTIDLTDAVVHIRAYTGSKYVPQVSIHGEHLVLSMAGFENAIPGRVIIYEGVYPWVHYKVQVLLDKTLMSFDTILHPQAGTGRQKRSVDDDVHYKLKPQSVVVPKNISFYSVSPEELENGQSIELEEWPMDMFLGNEQNDNVTFMALRNGSDLLLTNSLQLEEIVRKTITLEDFYDESPHPNQLHVWSSESMNETVTLDMLNVPRNVYNLSVHLPGLHLLINGSKIWNLTYDQEGESWRKNGLAHVGNYKTAFCSAASKMKPWIRELMREKMDRYCPDDSVLEIVGTISGGFIAVILLVGLGLGITVWRKKKGEDSGPIYQRLSNYGTIQG